jgi:carboxymethylenebutenolidase
MKNGAYTLLALIVIFTTACGEQVKVGEGKKEGEQQEFVALVNEDGFAEKHDEPLVLEVNAKGVMTTVEVENGKPANIYKIGKEGSANYLIVVHEWWGLNNHIISEADRFHDSLGNATVIALDLYDGNVATTREKATEYMKGADEERINAIIKSFLATLPEGARVATTGWCFGGGWSLKTALLAGSKTDACVIYYGMPVDDAERLKKLNSDVLFIFPEKDQWINAAVVSTFQSNMKTAGREVEVLAFDADHAFANPSSEKYVEEAAQKANAATLAYLRKRLK